MPGGDSDHPLRSYRFRRDWSAQWIDLEALIDRAEKDGLSSLDADELLRLPRLYRVCMSSLSVARSISLDANLLAYLESLAARAHFVIYGVRAGFGAALVSFFVHAFPRAVYRIRWLVLLSAAIDMAGIATAWTLTATDAAWFETFIDSGDAEGRTPAATKEELEATLFPHIPLHDSLLAFASFLFENNAVVAMLCFALGAMFGIPVVLLNFMEGLRLGALCAVFSGHDLTLAFVAWIAIHGTTELLAVYLCSGAGFHLAAAMISPGRRTRLAALADNGRSGAVVVVGAVVMLLVAALLEGLGRQLVRDTGLRLVIGGIMLASWLCYFHWCGRRGARRPATGNAPTTHHRRGRRSSVS